MAKMTSPASSIISWRSAIDAMAKSTFGNGRPRSSMVAHQVELGVGRRADLVEQLEQQSRPAGRRSR